MGFLTAEHEVSAQLDVKGSRFIAHVIPSAVWDIRLGELAVEHRKASHICTAMRRVAADNSIMERARDDGEPGGTAGRPILAVLTGADVVEAGIAVVRYFGGTKLGTGGLARAYGGAAAEALSKAGLNAWHRFGTIRLCAGFRDTNTLEHTVACLSLTILDRMYTENGTVLIVEGPEKSLRNPALSIWLHSKS